MYVILSSLNILKGQNHLVPGTAKLTKHIYFHNSLNSTFESKDNLQWKRTSVFFSQIMEPCGFLFGSCGLMKEDCSSRSQQNLKIFALQTAKTNLAKTMHTFPKLLYINAYIHCKKIAYKWLSMMKVNIVIYNSPNFSHSSYVF